MLKKRNNSEVASSSSTETINKKQKTQTSPSKKIVSVFDDEDDEDDEEEEDDDEEEDDEEEEDGEDGMGKNFGTKEERETYEKGLWMSYKDINTKMLSKYQSAVCILSHYVISVFMGLPFVKLTNKHTNRSKSRSGPSRRLGPCSSKPTKH